MLSQLLPLPLLLPFAAALAIIALWRAGARLWLLLRRARWLILALLLLFSLATPGVYLLPALGTFGPSEEGLRLGGEHALRLFAVLAALALLLQTNDREALLCGLHALMRPLQWFGVDHQRLAIRLILVLRYVEQAPPGRHWRAWLEKEEDATPAEQLIVLRRQRLRWRDIAVLAGLTFLYIALAFLLS